MTEVPQELEIRLADVDTQELVEDIEDKEIVLPDFQRDFVWPTDQIGALLDSILNGYYINTLLTLPVTHGAESNTPFPPREIKGVDQSEEFPIQMEMVLDGQQRVSSIYYALKAPEFPLSNTKYPQLFYLKLSKVIQGKFDDDIIDWRRRDWNTSKRLIRNDFGLQIDRDIIPFTVFKEGEFKEWRRGIKEYIDENSPTLENFGEVTKDDIDVFEDNTDVFRDYEIPIIQMGVSTTPRKVVQTFERINTQGLDLGIFDILTARLYPHGINLRELWDEAIEETGRVRNYRDNEGAKRARERTLRILALHRGEETKEESLGELEPKHFEKDWWEAISIFDRVLEKAFSSSEGGLGVTDKYGFPYGSILPPLANLIYEAESGTYPDGKALEKVRRWYWNSIFTKRYSGSSDTISYRDYNQVRSWFDNDAKLPEWIEEAPRSIPLEIDLDVLAQGGPYRGVMSLIVLNGAQDFGTFESIDVHQVDDHHIFPEAKLKDGTFGREYSESSDRNRILNRTVIQYRNNRFKYRDRVPSDYVAEMIDEHREGRKGVKRVLKKHFINEEAFEYLLADDYEGFCEARKEMMRKEIASKIQSEIDWDQSGEVN